MSPFELPPLPGSDREAAALRIGELYEQHHGMVRALCQLLLRNPVDAEDAVQQTFLCALDSLMDGTVPVAPAAWLATIARRECWARAAQRRRQPLPLDETTAPLADADPLDEAIRNADLTALWAAIKSLPRQQRKAFLMRELSGLSYAEVAEALGASESATESLLVRARRQVRDGLAPVRRSANLVTTPVMLLQHRLQRLFGNHAAGSGVGAGAATTTAAAPVAAKVAAAVVAVVAVGSAGANVAPHAGILADSAPRPATHVPSPGSVAESRRALRSSTAPAALAAKGHPVPHVRRSSGRASFEVRSGGSPAPAATDRGFETTTRTTTNAGPAAPGASPSAEPAGEPTATTGEQTLTQPTPVETTPGAQPSRPGGTPTETTDEPKAPAEPSPSATEEAGTDPVPAATDPAPGDAPDTAPADPEPTDTTAEETPAQDADVAPASDD